MIPKIAHFIWFGLEHPTWVNDNIKLFCDYHPSWEVKLHNEGTDWLSYIPSSLKDAAINSDRYCTFSDILSYSILEKEGGVYLDADMVTLRPIDNLLDCECFAGKVKSGQINCAVVGSIPHSKGISKVIDACEARIRLGEIQRASFGPRLLSRLFINTRKHPEISILPYHYFYLFRDHESAHSWWDADVDKRESLIDAEHSDFLDGINPYLIHLWGVDGSGLRDVEGGVLFD